MACNRYKLRSESARVAPEKRLHPGPPADHFDPGTTREVAMDADSEPETEGVGDEFANDKHFFLCTRVRDMREELGRRIQRMSAKSALTIADQLRLAYYEKTLRFFEPLPPKRGCTPGSEWRGTRPGTRKKCARSTKFSTISFRKAE